MHKKKKMTEEELRDWYDKTSMVDQGIVRPVKVTFAKDFKARVVGPRRLVALRLEADTLEKIKVLAVQKGLNYSTLMRMWITERLRQEKA
ncbi:MAG: hypothetical protein HY077_08100 [Elusimicrobia bacterium]|nr:hypothetical protein [Elusimicrobiota bacterium]